MAHRMPRLTEKDWVEIYYALDSKICGIRQGRYTFIGETNDEPELRRWCAQLLEIQSKIGPDGRRMWPKTRKE